MPGEVLSGDGAGEGSTIIQKDVDRVTDLLAENLPAESYLKMGKRDFFAEADVVTLHA